MEGRDPKESGAAMAAEWLVTRCDDQCRWSPVQEGEDPFPSLLCCGPEPAVVTNALKAFGQDVLQEAAEELVRVKGESAPLSVAAVFVFEGNVAVVVAEDALVAQGGTGDVGGKIFQGGFTAADGLHVDDPLLSPDGMRYEWQSFGSRFDECLFEAGAQTRSQHDLWEEVVGRRWSHPTQAIGAESASGHDAMNVRVVLELASPGVEHV